MRSIFDNIFSRNFRRARKGQALLEYGMLGALVAMVAIVAVIALGRITDDNLCKGANALGEVTGNIDPSCVDEVAEVEEKVSTGIGPDGFVDLYLALRETPVRHVLLPVANFDITGLDEVIVSTDRPDSVAACYKLESGQITCATMMGTMSAFDFPSNVVAVGYALLPVPDVRIEMAQPISITLGSRANPALNRTWDIFAYREAVPNLFEPEFEFNDRQFLAGMVSEQTVLVPLAGDFSEDDLLIALTPGENTGAFAGCGQSATATAARCDLLQSEASTSLVPSDGKALGYQIFLPRDVRIAVDWPLEISVASSFDPEVKKSWSINITRPAGEAPAFPEMVFEDTEFPADTAGRNYVMVAHDQSYPSDMRIWIPRSEAGLRACYQERADSAPVCSADAGSDEVKFIVPAGSYALGLGVDLPQDVLVEYARRAVFSINAVDYPDFNDEFDIALTRPAFVPVFEPSFAFGDVTFPEGSTGWQTHLVEMTGNLNSTLTMTAPTDQSGVRLCYQADQDGPVTCSGSGARTASVSTASAGSGSIFSVPSSAYAIGFSLDLGDSAFQEVSRSISFGLRHSRNAEMKRDFGLNASRAATAVIFEPDTGAMVFHDEAWPEATEGWQEPQMVEKAGAFNTDLRLSIASGNDAGVCYALSAGSEPVCSASALTGAQALVVPMEATRIGVRTFLSDALYEDMDRSVAFALGSTEAEEASVPFTYQVSRPAVPVLFDASLGFRDKTFAADATGRQLVMVPIEGEITTGMTMHMPKTASYLRACYVETEGDPVACSISTSVAAINFDVPRNAAHVGFEVDLPTDRHADWSMPVQFTISSDADANLSYAVDITVDRTAVPVVVAPTTRFEDITFEAGTRGMQTVIANLVGEFSTDVQVRISQTGQAVAPCVEKWSGTTPGCAADTVEADRVAKGDWSAEQRALNSRIHGVGYRVDLPQDIHQPVDWQVEMRLESVYDASVGTTYAFRIQRPVEPVIWAPGAMDFPDMEFAVRESGTHSAMIPFTGDFTTDTDFTIAATGHVIRPCYREVASGAIQCGDSSELASAMVQIGPNWEAIGYQIELPSDLAQEVDRNVQVNLRSSYDPNLSRTGSFRVYREPAPVVFSPTVSFNNQVFTRGEIGWVYNMEPLTGELTTSLELVAPGNQPIKVCARDTADADLRCVGGGITSVDKVLPVSPTAYAIGAGVQFPQDPWAEASRSAAFNLRMKDFPSQKRDYAYDAQRRALDITFSTSLHFTDLDVAVNETGWKTVLEPLSGNFSTDLEWLTATPGEDLRLCAQASSSLPVTCASAGSASMTVGPDTYAVGYAVELNDDPFAEVDRAVQLRLQSAEAPSVGVDAAPVVNRPGRPVDFPADGFFAKHTFAAGATGTKTVMKPMNGVGNTPTTLTLARVAANIRLCIQDREGGPIACEATAATDAAQSKPVSSSTYAVGYRVGLPSDPFEVFSKPVTLTFSSDTVEGAEKVFSFTVDRTVQDPIMPGPEFFTNKTYQPGTLGTQSVMVALDPRTDTDLTFSKAPDQFGLGLCVQTAPSGPITCAGENTGRDFEINDTDRSWYAIGYRFSLGDDPDTEFFETLRLGLTSQDVPSAKSSYKVLISRLSLNAVMPDRTFFSDMAYPEGETGQRTVMVPLGQTDINLVLHKAAAQPGLQLCYQTGANTDPVCSGDTEEAHRIDVSSSWYAIGYRFSLGASKFNPVDETFVMHITSRDGVNNRVDYAVHVTRPHTVMVMPGADLFASEATYPEGTLYTQTVMATIPDNVNTALSITKAAGQSDLQLCHQATEGGAILCYGSSNAGEFELQLALDAYAVGYRFDLGDNEFVGFDKTYDFIVRSRDETTEQISFSVDVSRPAKEVRMPPEGLFADVNIPVSTTGGYSVLVPAAGVFDTATTLTLSNNEESWPFRACFKGGSNTICADTEDNTRVATSSVTFQPGVQEIGFFFGLPANEFEHFNYPLQLTLTSNVDPTKTRTYDVIVRREPAEVVLPPEDLFGDVTLASTQTNVTQVMVDVRGLSTSNMFLKLSAQDFPISLCYQTSSSPNCPASALNSDATMLYTPTYNKIGFAVNTGSSQFQPFDKEITLRIEARDDPTQFVDYPIRITREATEVNLPPEDFFPDVVLASTDTGGQVIEASIQGMLNAPVKMTMSPQADPIALCYRSPSTGKLYCSSSAHEQEGAVTYNQAHKFAGFSFNAGSDRFSPFERVLQFRIESIDNPDRYRDYSVRVTRPAMEANFPDQALFDAERLSPSATGQQTVMRNIAGVLNTSLRLEITDPDPFQICWAGSRVSCPVSSSGGSETLDLPTSIKQLGFRVDAGSVASEAFSRTISFRLVAIGNPEVYRDYTLTINRPAVAIVLPPEDFFQDVTIASNQTNWVIISKDISSFISGRLRMVMPAHGFDVAVCKRTSAQASPTCPWRATTRSATESYSDSDLEMGYAVSTGYNTSVDFERQIQFRVESIDDPSQFRDYSLTFRRPAQ